MTERTEADALQSFARELGFSDPYDAMRSICRDVRTRARQVHPPIALSPIWRALGVEVSESDLRELGQLEVKPDGYTVRLSATGSWQQKRFTIAHELGHVLLLRTVVADAPEVVRDLVSSHRWDAVERLCNWAAAELLLPVDTVPRVELTALTAGTIPALLELFRVSLGALLIRLTELQPELHVTVWRRFARHEREAVCWRVVRSHAGTARLRFPDGITTKHLSTDLIERAAHTGQPVLEPVVFSLRRGVEVSGQGCAVPLPRTHVRPTLFSAEPSFEHLQPMLLFIHHAPGVPPSGGAKSTGQLTFPLW